MAFFTSHPLQTMIGPSLATSRRTAPQAITASLPAMSFSTDPVLRLPEPFRGNVMGALRSCCGPKRGSSEAACRYEVLMSLARSLDGIAKGYIVLPSGYGDVDPGAFAEAAKRVASCAERNKPFFSIARAPAPPSIDPVEYANGQKLGALDCGHHFPRVISGTNPSFQAGYKQAWNAGGCNVPPPPIGGSYPVFGSSRGSWR